MPPPSSIPSPAHPTSTLPLPSQSNQGPPASYPAAPTQASIRALALSSGFIEAGMVSLPHTDADKDASRFTEFITSGHAGTMAYLARRNEHGKLLRSSTQLPFPWARSAIVCLAGYHSAQPLSTDPAPPNSIPGAGWIARYAWSGERQQDGSTRPADYHKFLLRRLKLLESALHATHGYFESRAYVDTGPVSERSLARAAGVGWTGKNTCLIHPKLGSWSFLAVLITSLELPPASAPLVVPDRCGSCRRCIEACPTQALIEPYRMDASRCISYLTIEHRGEIAAELLPGMGRQVFGCDICQDVCPYNRKAPIQIAQPAQPALPALDQSDGVVATREQLVNPALDWLAELDYAAFERLFNGSPVRRAGFEGFRRNIAIAMGNSGLTKFTPWLRRWATDPGLIRPQDRKAAINGPALKKSGLLGSRASWGRFQRLIWFVPGGTPYLITCCALLT